MMGQQAHRYQWLMIFLPLAIISLAAALIYWPQSARQDSDGSSGMPPSSAAASQAVHLSSEPMMNAVAAAPTSEPTEASIEAIPESTPHSAHEPDDSATTRSSPKSHNRPNVPPRSAMAEELMAQLSELDPNIELTREDLDYVSRLIRSLIAQGSSALPSIREFLESGRNLSFSGLRDSNYAPEYESLRLALIDALGQIGGFGAETILSEELAVAILPAEVSALAEHLQTLAPELYLGEIIDAARASLEYAAENGLGWEAGALFQVLQEQGNAEIILDLYRDHPEWGYYSKVALSGLPDGQGISTLIDLAEQTDLSTAGTGIFTDERLFAVQMLAQASVANAEAQQAFIEQARDNRIPEALWPRLASALAGDDQFVLEKTEKTGSASMIASRRIQSQAPRVQHAHNRGYDYLYPTSVRPAIQGRNRRTCRVGRPIDRVESRPSGDNRS